MADFREIYKEPLLSAKRFKDLKLKPFTEKITSVDVESFENSEGKDYQALVLTLGDGDYRIRLNKGNAISLLNSFGKDYDTWTGKTVAVGLGKTQFAGKICDGLTVEASKKK